MVVSVHQPAQGGLIDRFRVCALTHLRKLLWIAKQEKPLRCHGGADRRSQCELPGLVNDQKIKAFASYPRGVRKRSMQCRQRRNRNRRGRPGTVPLSWLFPDESPRGQTRLGSGLAHQVGRSAGLHGACEHVLNGRVRLGDDADPPMVLLDEFLDDPRVGEGLASSWRSLNGERAKTGHK